MLSTFHILQSPTMWIPIHFLGGPALPLSWRSLWVLQGSILSQNFSHLEN